MHCACRTGRRPVRAQATEAECHTCILQGTSSCFGVKSCLSTVGRRRPNGDKRTGQGRSLSLLGLGGGSALLTCWRPRSDPPGSPVGRGSHIQRPTGAYGPHNIKPLRVRPARQTPSRGPEDSLLGRNRGEFSDSTKESNGAARGTAQTLTDGGREVIKTHRAVNLEDINFSDKESSSQ